MRRAGVQRTARTYNVLLAVLTAVGGRGGEALALLGQMQREGVAPDHGTYMGVLTACRPSADQARLLRQRSLASSPQRASHHNHLFESASATTALAAAPATKGSSAVVHLEGATVHPNHNPLAALLEGGVAASAAHSPHVADELPTRGGIVQTGGATAGVEAADDSVAQPAWRRALALLSTMQLRGSRR